MTGRERLLAVAAGGQADQTPVIVFPGLELESDASALSAGAAADGQQAMLIEVLSPLARAIERGYELSRAIHDCPEEGLEVLAQLKHDVVQEIESALRQGADGIFYRLKGAEPAHSTPMEYGGHYLELDRELLDRAASLPLNVVFVEGGRETYFDFVSDLPAQVFAWDLDATEVSVSAVRAMRPGALATASKEADILFGSDFQSLQPLIVRNGVGVGV